MALEPLYSIEVAAELIPVRKNTLEVFLHRHKDEFPVRMHTGEMRASVRMLTESECLKIREMMIRPATRGRKGIRRDFSLRTVGRGDLSKRRIVAGYDILFAKDENVG